MNTATTTERRHRGRRYTVLLLLGLLLNAGFLPAQNITRPNIEGPAGLQANSYTGSLFYQRTDLLVPGRGLSLNCMFTYNSSERARDEGYGFGWTFGYNIFYTLTDTTVTIHQADARQDIYKKDGSTFKSPAGIFDKLTSHAAGKFKLRTKDGTEYFFGDATHKKLTGIVDRNGNTVTLTYDNGTLSTIADASGRTLQLIWEKKRLVQLKADFSGSVRNIHYTYDTTGLLKSVKDPLNNSVFYTYARGRLMDTYADLNGNVHHILYNSNNAVSKFVSCDAEKSISYNAAELKTYVTNYNNDLTAVTIYAFDKRGRLIARSGNCCGYNTTYSYDEHDNINQFTDANGHTTTYTYDGNGNILSETDPLNQTTLYTYESAFNKITSATDKQGNTTTYQYDTKGNLLQEQQPVNTNIQYVYDANGMVKEITNPRGHKTIFAYDAYGSLTTITYANNETIILTSDIWGNRLTRKDGRGNTTTWAYDARNRLTTTTDALGHTKKITRDPAGNILTYADGNNNKATYIYNAAGQPLSITDANNQVIIHRYDGVGNLSTLTDRNGNSTTYTYDKQNRRLSSTNALGEPTYYQYDANGNRTVVSLPNGNVINFKYDVLDRLVEVTDNLGTLGKYQYDANDNIIMETDAKGNAITYAYDALGRPLTKTDALGNTWAFTYDEGGNKLTEKDRNGHVIAYSYDVRHRMLDKVDAEGFRTEYTYDATGNMTSIKDEQGKVTQYSYDLLNRVLTEQTSDNKIWAYTYDAAGNLQSRKDAKGQLTTYAYDKLNRPIAWMYPGGIDSLAYDAEGNLLRAKNLSAVVTFSYDKVNRVLQESLNGKITGYQYNVAAGIKKITYPGGRVIERVMDKRDQLTGITGEGRLLAALEYNSTGDHVGKKYGNGIVDTRTYDVNGEVLTVQNSNAGLSGMVYQHDAEGYPVRINHANSVVEEYNYDKKNQLTSYKKGSVQHTWQYNGAGNRTAAMENGASVQYVSNNAHAYTSITHAGTASNYAYDDNGNKLSDGARQFTYDIENRLTAINAGINIHYAYDALGRRVSKQVNDKFTHYYYDGFQVIEERGTVDTVIASYVWGENIDDILSMRRNGRSYYYHTNALGSVTALTDSIGTVVERYEYDPFGKVRFYDKDYNLLPGSQVANTYTFTGREWEPELQAYYYRARHYDAGEGHFLQQDPLGFAGSDYNLYAYVKNQPTSFIDPFGLTETKKCPPKKKNWYEYVKDLILKKGPVSVDPVKKEIKYSAGPLSVGAGGNREDGLKVEVAAEATVKHPNGNEIGAEVAAGITVKPDDEDMSWAKVHVSAKIGATVGPENVRAGNGVSVSKERKLYSPYRQAYHKDFDRARKLREAEIVD
ncbi:MAG: RHS repeat protein [Niastella sp.]|nr:RHS repeat protein [Niastella sp.]